MGHVPGPSRKQHFNGCTHRKLHIPQSVDAPPVRVLQGTQA